MVLCGKLKRVLIGNNCFTAKESEELKGVEALIPD
jgi:hypothetical protein